MIEGGSRRGTCPYCGATYIYSETSRLSDGTVKCQNCEAAFAPAGDFVYSDSTPQYADTQQVTQSSDSWIIILVIVLEILFVPIWLLIIVLPVTWWWWTNRNKNKQQRTQPSSSSLGW